MYYSKVLGTFLVSFLLFGCEIFGTKEPEPISIDELAGTWNSDIERTEQLFNNFTCVDSQIYTLSLVIDLQIDNAQDFEGEGNLTMGCDNQPFYFNTQAITELNFTTPNIEINFNDQFRIQGMVDRKVEINGILSDENIDISYKTDGFLELNPGGSISFELNKTN